MKVRVPRSKGERPFYFQGSPSCPPCRHLGLFSRKICPGYSLGWGEGLMPASSSCPFGFPDAGEVVVVEGVVGVVVPLGVRPWAGSG